MRLISKQDFQGGQARENLFFKQLEITMVTSCRIRK